MSEPKHLVHHVSDTALWAAIHRAKETDRPDAQFCDPFARRLAGDRGEQIAAGLAVAEADSWSWMARTWLFDNFIEEKVKQGVDMVVNLGAGLDTRPYRTSWPAGLTWVEVDLPDILDYKEEILAADQPLVPLERIRLDLADDVARRSLLKSLGSRATKVLILTEGVLIYLTLEQAVTLSEDLAAVPAFNYWLVDIVSSGLLNLMKERTQNRISENAVLQFAPPGGPEFFDAHGWRAADVQSLLKTAGRLNRLPPEMQPFMNFPEDPVRMSQIPWGGVCLLEK
ncbi:MAG TPA: SAM-dependent methyltransferase [Bryobacteraceae bacterium]|nr:SAM-dependent methyltransferase [Bryobacteraceae bacterium]